MITFENVLLDAARISDERGAAPELELSMDDFDFEESSPGVEVDVPAMIELAARAVRSSRFRDAYVAYARVLEVEPQNSLARLNASRLRKLGFGDEAREAS